MKSIYPSHIYRSVADARPVPFVYTVVLSNFSMVFENDYLRQDLVIPSDCMTSGYLKQQVLLLFLSVLSLDPCTLSPQTALSVLISVERCPAF